MLRALFKEELMSKFLEIIQMLAGMDWAGIIAAFFVFVGAFTSMLTALIAVFAKIPGKQPEAFLQKVVDFIAKYSKK